MNQRVDNDARLIWDYHHMYHQLMKADVIFVLCSIDERVAEYAAKLFIEGYGNRLVFSGGVAHTNDLLKTSWQGSEAEHFAAIAVRNGVDPDDIIIETKATNTGENIRFSYEVLQERGLVPQSMLLVQKPYMERRTYVTFMQQWPGKAKIFVTSPPIGYEDYFNRSNPKGLIVNIMVGDLQRIREYPKLGFQIEQEIPDDVWQAYERLAAAGYDKHLIK